jgi:hypothetical protein
MPDWLQRDAQGMFPCLKRTHPWELPCEGCRLERELLRPGEIAIHDNPCLCCCCCLRYNRRLPRFEN